MSNASKASPTMKNEAGTVTFVNESAGFKNALGMYKIAADGTIYDVEIVFANASLKDSGGDLAAGKSSVGVDVANGDNVGFFVVPNGFAQSGMAKLLGDTSGSFKFVGADGSAGNVNGGAALKLVHVSASGAETDVKSQYGTTTFHSVDDGSLGLNGDGLNHVKITTENGVTKIGFEDLKGGGDKDFDDSVFSFRTDPSVSDVEVQVGRSVKANNDDLKHDGRGHGDGDHNDDGHTDNGKGAGKAETLPSTGIAIGTELLVDGSFEQSSAKNNSWTAEKKVGGWTSDTQVETWGKGFYGIKATDGNKIAELDFDKGMSNIYQDVQTEAGAEYAFSFDYMKRPDSKAGSDTINVYWNGQLVGTVDPSKSAWETATFTVVGTGGNDRIEFRESADDNDSYGGLIDNASLKKTADPVPTTIDVAAVDANDVAVDSTMIGDDGDNDFVGGNGRDTIIGGKGNDVIVGDATGRATFALEIKAALSGKNVDPNAFAVTLSNIPDDATLSAGIKNADGTWTLTSAELDGLTMTASDDAALKIGVTATATDGSGATATTAISVTFQGGAEDELVGGSGNDTIFGNAGDDVMYGSNKPTGTSNPNPPKAADNDLLKGGDGNDRMYGNHGDDTLHGDGGNDWISGGKGDDLIYGGDGNNELYGNSGDDRFVMEGGSDIVVGGSGFDTIDFGYATGGVVVNLHDKAYSGFGSGTVSGVENVSGSDYDDVIVANGKANTFTGNGGNDTYAWFWGDAKNGADVITDFATGDVLDLSRVLKGNTANLAVKAADDGTHVYAYMNKAWHEVVVLEGYNGSADDMLKAGMILAG